MKVKDFVDTYLVDEPFAVFLIDEDEWLYSTVGFNYGQCTAEMQEKKDKYFKEVIGDMYYVWYVGAKTIYLGFELPYTAVYVDTFERR